MNLKAEEGGAIEARAISLAAGFSIIPLVDSTKLPAIPSWGRWQRERADIEQVIAWMDGEGLIPALARRPGLEITSKRNTAIVTGRVSGIVVLDLDNRSVVAEAFNRGLPDTVAAQTPRGLHVYFAYPAWPVGNKTSLKQFGFDGADVRGNGGYVVGPGSYFEPTADEAAIGKIAGEYRWLMPPVENPIAPMPDWLADMLEPKPSVHEPKPMTPVTWTEPADASPRDLAYARAVFENAIEQVRTARPGTRNTELFKGAASIGSFVASGLIDEAMATDALYRAALAAATRPDISLIRGTIRRGLLAGSLVPRRAPPPSASAVRAAVTRLGQTRL